MRLLGVGLSKTGTTSLYRALRLLGFRCIHYDTKRLNDVLMGTTTTPRFDVYDDVDAVLDIPSAYFYRELLQTYPEARAVLTVRDEDSWWGSVSYHFNTADPVPAPLAIDRMEKRFRVDWLPGHERRRYNQFRRALRTCVYGSVQATEFLYKKRFREHNERVQADIPPSRLLVMNITAGDGWEALCPFLGIDAPPSEPFPHAKKRAELA